MEMEDKYRKYDEIVAAVAANVLVEKKRCGKYIIFDFDPEDGANRLYYNVTTMMADLDNEKVYLNISLLNFIKFRIKRSKKRTNLRWLNPFQNKKIEEKNKVSAFVLMSFVAKELCIPYSLFKEINNEYYGGH